MNNLLRLQAKERYEQEHNMPPSKTSADFVRNNVVIRKIQMLFKATLKDVSKEELEEFEKIYMILDKDLDLKKEEVDKLQYQQNPEKNWESKGLGRTEKVVDTTSLFRFLDDSNSLKRQEMYFWGYRALT
jgi:hypothetical protein